MNYPESDFESNLSQIPNHFIPDVAVKDLDPAPPDFKNSYKRINEWSLKVWKAFNQGDWDLLSSLLLSLKKEGTQVVINTSDPIPFDIQSSVFYNSKPIIFLHEVKSILDELALPDMDVDSYHYNEFIISSYLYSLMKYCDTKIIFIKAYDRHIVISCLSSSFIDIHACFNAIIGSGENYKASFNMQYQQNQDRSWTINCSIPLSSEQNDRVKSYSIYNSTFHHKGLANVKLLAGGSYANTALTIEIANNQHAVYKSAKGKGFSKLRDEILWIKKLSPKIKELYPEILNYEINDDKEECWMEQIYYPWPSVTSYLMNNGFNRFSNYHYNTVEILNFLIDIVYQNKNLFYIHEVEPAPDDFFERFHKNKIRDRLLETQSIDPSFESFIHAPYLILDGDQLLGPLQLLECFEQINQLTHLLHPPYLCTLHGDLNIGNILVDPASFKSCYKNYGNLPVKYIDPRGWIDHKTGELKGQDYMYDVAKIAYHFFGYYDQVRANMVNIVIDDKVSSIPEFSIVIPQYDYDKQEFTDSAAKQYYHLQAAMLNYVIQEKKFLELEDEEIWKIRFMFTLGSCMISDIPFLLQGPEGNKKALEIFMLGTRFFNYAWEMIITYFQNHPNSTLNNVISELVHKYPIYWKSPFDRSSNETILENLGMKLSPIANLYL
ncbi:hypothetical protein [Paenibacillus caui]|uniref:hypothetical protein n=1 Tax=Paenibacillus caui TaxID=2873927 RepID=UPI001CA9925E|nr:hypothetical protein [Paenibacillus caui]